MPIEHVPPHLSYVLKRQSTHAPEIPSSDRTEVMSPGTDVGKMPSPPLSPVTYSTDKQEKISAVTDPIPQSSNMNNNAFMRWFRGLTSTQQLILKVTAISFVLLAVITAIIVPIGISFEHGCIVQIYLISATATVNRSVSSCPGSTCIGNETPYRSSVTTLLYPFDGNMNDLIGNNIGVPLGNTLPAANVQGYVNQGLILSLSAQQYVLLPPVNFARQSFTLQVWIYPTIMSIAVEMAIFSQCDPTAICFTLSIRNARLAMSFDSMNTSSFLLGTAVLARDTWIHVTVVYDAALRQQQMYVNGRMDAISTSPIDPYRGVTLGSVATVGRYPNTTSGFFFFDGRVDHLMISLGTVRSACQIYNDATLTAYFPLDIAATTNDYSAHLCNGITAGTTIVSTGRINQALSYSLSTSYFQAQCFSSIRLLNPAYTVSLWIRPSITTNGGSLVHLSSLANGGGTCYDLLVFTAGGALVAQYMGMSGNVFAILGPLIPINTWTHVAIIYGNSNGVRLYVNGQLAVSSLNVNAMSLTNPMTPLFITLGNISPLGSSASITCTNGTIPIASGSYTGIIDDFRLYNREIDAQELCMLTNL